MLVAFGPKKIKFRGSVAVETDFAAQTGSLRGRGAADMRAARIEVRIAYALRDDPAAPGATAVKLTSDAELGGVLADFARTGGVPFANALMADFSKRVADGIRDRRAATGRAGANPRRSRRTGCSGR